MTVTKKNWFMGAAVALITAAITACSGGSGGGKDVATDGVLGEVPAVAAKYLPDINEARHFVWRSSSEENREKYAKKFDELKLKWEEAAKAIPSIAGKEIPLEVDEGLPLKPVANLKITKVNITDTDIKVFAETTTKTTADFAMKEVANLILVGITSDGKPVFSSTSTPFTLRETEAVFNNKTQAYKPDVEGKTRVVIGTPSVTTLKIWEAPELYGKLAKVVIMNRESEAYKQIEAELKSLVEAADDNKK